MFYYARQTPAENIDTTFEIDAVLDCTNTPVIVFGNRHYIGYNEDELPGLEEFFYEAIEDLDTALDNYMNFFNGNDSKIPVFQELFKSFTEDTAYSNEIAAKLLTIKYGVKYELRCIRGCCQGDWQYVLASEDFDFDYLEALYFGMVTEYAISEDKLESPDDFEDAGCYFCFVVDDTEEKMRKALADMIGCKSEELKIATITGSYTRTCYEYSDFN